VWYLNEYFISIRIEWLSCQSKISFLVSFITISYNSLHTKCKVPDHKLPTISKARNLPHSIIQKTLSVSLLHFLTLLMLCKSRLLEKNHVNSEFYCNYQSLIKKFSLAIPFFTVVNQKWYIAWNIQMSIKTRNIKSSFQSKTLLNVNFICIVSGATKKTKWLYKVSATNFFPFGVTIYEWRPSDCS